MGKFPEFEELTEISKKHDESKLKDPERTPYIFVSWKHRCKDLGKTFDFPESVLDNMNEATNIHVKSDKNRHHPESWLGDEIKKENLINTEDRDKPKATVDATKMEELYISEMCADWCAVSEERHTSPIEWAKNNIGTRWKFSDNQEDLIYAILSSIWTATDNHHS